MTHLYNCLLFLSRKADPEHSNPLFENHEAKPVVLKDRLEISEPTFISTTMTKSGVLHTAMPVLTAPQVSS